MNDPDSNPEVIDLIKAQYATGGSPLLFPQLHKAAAAAPEPAPAPAAAPVLKKAAPAGPTGKQLLDQVRACLPELVGEWLKKVAPRAAVDVPVMKSGAFLDVQARAQRVGLVPLVRFEVDDQTPLRFAKMVRDQQIDLHDLSQSRPQLLQAALRSMRGSITLRDTKLIAPRGDAESGPHRIFKAYRTDDKPGIDRNFATFDAAVEWLDRAGNMPASQELAKREPSPACLNPSFLACAA